MENSNCVPGNPEFYARLGEMRYERWKRIAIDVIEETTKADLMGEEIYRAEAKRAKEIIDSLRSEIAELEAKLVDAETLP